MTPPQNTLVLSNESLWTPVSSWQLMREEKTFCHANIFDNRLNNYLLEDRMTLAVNNEPVLPKKKKTKPKTLLQRCQPRDRIGVVKVQPFYLLWRAASCSRTATQQSPAGSDTEPACPGSCCGAPPPGPAPPSGRPCDLWLSPTGSPRRGTRLCSGARRWGGTASGASPWPAGRALLRKGRPVLAGRWATWWGRRRPPAWRVQGRGRCPGWAPIGKRKGRFKKS